MEGNNVDTHIAFSTGDFVARWKERTVRTSIGKQCRNSNSLKFWCTEDGNECQDGNAYICSIQHTGNDRRCFRSFQDGAFAGDLSNTKSTSGGVLCTSSHTFCVGFANTQNEDEIISLVAGLRTEGTPQYTEMDVLEPIAQGDLM